MNNLSVEELNKQFPKGCFVAIEFEFRGEPSKCVFKVDNFEVNENNQDEIICNAPFGINAINEFNRNTHYGINYSVIRFATRSEVSNLIRVEKNNNILLSLDRDTKLSLYEQLKEDLGM